MNKYTIKIELLSETIFSGGGSIVSISDLDVLYDEYGIPYYKAKSLKGNLRETIDMIVNNLSEKSKLEYKNISNRLFGMAYDSKSKYKDSQEEGILNFENATLKKEVCQYLMQLIKDDNNKIIKDEVIKSLTDIRYFTKIDDKTNTSKDGSLRSIRVLNKGICMYSDIYTENELSEDELALLYCGVKSLRHLGSLRSRGKGLVKCDLLIDDKELEENKANILVNKVVK